jgi:hypothetical protein
MPRINLATVRKDHPPALAIGKRVPAMRLVAHVSLATTKGWTTFDPAVIDTGAPLSVFPPAIWTDSNYHPMGRVRIGGLSRRRDCQIPAILASVRCTLSDGVSSVGPLDMHAYLALHDDVPTLIGMLGFVERGILHIDIQRSRTYLRMP